MIQRSHQLEELEEARALQDRLSQLHIPCPVIHWEYKIIGKQGAEKESGIGKSNSYTRNALNGIAYFPGFCDNNLCNATIFGDGSINTKLGNGTIINPNTTTNRLRYSSVNAIVYVGVSDAAESLDSYAVPLSGMLEGTTSVSSAFNSTTRKLITVMSRVFQNNTESQIDVVESGVSIYGGSDVTLVIRDVFDTIAVGPLETMIWTYVTEVSYPNP